MQPTLPAELYDLLCDLLAGLRGVFGDELAGVYLYGSSVAGDFDAKRSDVDLLIACASDVAGRMGEIDAFHGALIRARPAWEDRIDAVFAPIAALRDFRTQVSWLAFVSPGEPLHLRETGEVWLVNWHLVREIGVTLVGPSPRALIAPTTQAEFVAAVRAHLRGWPDWIKASDRPGFHAYTVLTICRALHVCRNGNQLSKPQAARWAAAEYPQWAALIASALAWRSQPVARELGRGAVELIDFAIRETGV